MDWLMADAKNRFSEVINRAISEGPQRVRRRNDAVIMVSEAEFLRLAGERPDFKRYLLEGESLEGLDLARDPSMPRDVEL
jgi:prevent-host-death family protein